MQGPATVGRQVSPAAIRWAVIAALVLVGGWMAMHAYTGDTARGCGRLYHAAHNAADSARVDTMVPSARSGEGVQVHSCGYLRSKIR